MKVQKTGGSIFNTLLYHQNQKKNPEHKLLNNQKHDIINHPWNYHISKHPLKTP